MRKRQMRSGARMGGVRKPSRYDFTWEGGSSHANTGAAPIDDVRANPMLDLMPMVRETG